MRLTAAWAGDSKNLSFVYQNYKISADTSKCTGVSPAGRAEPYDAGKMERFRFLAKKFNLISYSKIIQSEIVLKNQSKLSHVFLLCKFFVS